MMRHSQIGCILIMFILTQSGYSQSKDNVVDIKESASRKILIFSPSLLNWEMDIENRIENKLEAYAIKNDVMFFKNGELFNNGKSGEISYYYQYSVVDGGEETVINTITEHIEKGYTDVIFMGWQMFNVLYVVTKQYPELNYYCIDIEPEDYFDYENIYYGLIKYDEASALAAKLMVSIADTLDLKGLISYLGPNLPMYQEIAGVFTDSLNEDGIKGYKYFFDAFEWKVTLQDSFLNAYKDGSRLFYVEAILAFLAELEISEDFAAIVNNYDYEAFIVAPIDITKKEIFDKKIKAILMINKENIIIDWIEKIYNNIKINKVTKYGVEDGVIELLRK